MKHQPYIIHFSKIGASSMGYLSIAEIEKSIPFIIKRVFWAYFTPEDVKRGAHAHHETEMVLIAVAGKIKVVTEMANNVTEEFILDRPNEGVFLPKKCWHTLQYSHNAVQLVLASTLYDEQDYIRDYQKFRQ
jgi:dTDP-4-dehydrorhamnose 3,5-epimerase-like enzyme